MSVTPRAPDTGLPRGAPIGALAGPPEFSLAEINGAISRVTGLPAEFEGLAHFAGQVRDMVNQNPSLRMAGLGGAGFMSLLMAHLPPDLSQAMDPAKRNELMRQQERNAGLAAGGLAASGGVQLFGQSWMHANSGGDRGLASGGRSSSQYGQLNSAAGSADAAFYRSVGISDVVGKGLSALGFTSQEQIRQVLNDANRLGLNVNQAALSLGRLRKFEGIRVDQHIDQLQHYRQDMQQLDQGRKLIDQIANPAERAQKLREHEEKVREREKQLNKYRDDKVQTPQGKKEFENIRRQIRSEDAARMKKDGPQAGVHDEGHEQRPLDNRQAGVDTAIENQRRADVARVETPAVAVRRQVEANDTLAAFADDKPAASPSSGPQNAATPGANPPATKAPEPKQQQAENAQQPKAPQQPKQAANTKGMNPTV